MGTWRERACGARGRPCLARRVDVALEPPDPRGVGAGLAARSREGLGRRQRLEHDESASPTERVLRDERCGQPNRGISSAPGGSGRTYDTDGQVAVGAARHLDPFVGDGGLGDVSRLCLVDRLASLFGAEILQIGGIRVRVCELMSGGLKRDLLG